MPLFRIIRLKFGRRFGCLWAISLSAVWTSHAQLDPEPRHLLHVGVSQSLHNDGPQARYLFFYWNTPNFPSTNQILRLVVAPTYLDSELGFKGLLGKNTDLGVGIFGGGYAATAVVNYVSGLEQPGHWNSGVVGAIGYTARNR